MKKKKKRMEHNLDSRTVIRMPLPASKLKNQKKVKLLILESSELIVKIDSLSC